MLQLIGLLTVTWLLLWFFEKKDLAVLGLMPTKPRMQYAAILFAVTAALSASAFGLRMFIAQEEYTLVDPLTANTVLLESWYQVRSVLTEELLCRGALLYLLIRRLGARKAIVISSVLFAVLHWTNAGVWGNVVQMALLFVFTFAMGLLLAYAYARSFSLLIPFAIHFGWNLVQNYIFPDTPSGNHLFILAAPPPTVTISYVAFFTMLLFPKVSLLVSDYLIVKRHRQVEMP